MFKKVLITEEMIKIAEQRAKQVPTSRHTFMDFERHKVGFIGEEIFKNVFLKLKLVRDLIFIIMITFWEKER